MSVFEIIMLLCFGVAWPFSIYKSYKSKSVEGKSVIFLIVVIIGYASGILHKIFYNYDKVIYLYATNMTMASIDFMLYINNWKIGKKNEKIVN
ncbi:hypothetical protein G9F71_015085 [Clostridium sp. FP2]|uniref:hypothetical protein n=1 Tax=Clostridium TaxID=1485 RepID=UPI0013E9186B|nr:MULTISPECIES: hypothetical protein [Clostridium]MBW9156018.1 hypothetical protein [Clostridium tagluense]MBZ9624175.1 hypothetical protein [Clostridium sp. FP2]MCB2298457.1 hypothetical protein [Clostridium tagluense]WLC64064.1 hypothetical protein KTC93_14400 [Clostridium tagluense]